MKVLHINAGLESGGGLTHIVNLLSQAKKAGQDFDLLTFAEGPVAQAAREKGIKTIVLGGSSRYDLALLKRLNIDGFIPGDARLYDKVVKLQREFGNR